MISKEDRRQALEKLGVHVESGGISVARGTVYLVNLSADPSMTEMLVYYLKEETRVGSEQATQEQDIKLMGIGIKKEHCLIQLQDSQVFLVPLPGARSCVNGKDVVERTRLYNGDRILWGSNHFFRITCPSGSNEPKQDCFDWNKAQEEVIMGQGGTQKMDEIIAKLEKKYFEEKQAALDSQRLEYEKQYKQMKIKAANYELEQDAADGTAAVVDQDKVSLWLSVDRESKEKSDAFKKSLSELKSGLVKASGLIREASFLATEMRRAVSYSLTLQMPMENLSPNNASGVFISEPSILVKGSREGCQVWSVEKLNNKLNDMVEVYEQLVSQDLPFREHPKILWRSYFFNLPWPISSMYKINKNHFSPSFATTIFTEMLTVRLGGVCRTRSGTRWRGTA